MHEQFSWLAVESAGAAFPLSLSFMVHFMDFIKPCKGFVLYHSVMEHMAANSSSLIDQCSEIVDPIARIIRFR